MLFERQRNRLLMCYSHLMEGVMGCVIPCQSGIISCLNLREIAMEAERINAISNLLAELVNREVELRGYL